MLDFCWNIVLQKLLFSRSCFHAAVFAVAHDAIQIVKEPHLKELPVTIPNKFLHCKGGAEVR